MSHVWRHEDLSISTIRKDDSFGLEFKGFTTCERCGFSYSHRIVHNISFFNEVTVQGSDVPRDCPMDVIEEVLGS